MATNYTPATAFVIDRLPYSNSQNDIYLAPDDLVNIPAGESHAWNAVWYTITPTVDQEFLFITTVPNPYPTLSGDYTPLVSVWVGTPGSLTAYVIIQPGTDSTFVNQAYDGYYIRIPLVAGTQYWIQICNDNSTTHATADVSLSFLVSQPVRTSAPIGSIVVTDDALEFPGSILDASTFQFLQYRNELPPGEFGNVLPTGEICTAKNDTNTDLYFLDGQLNLVNTVALGESINQILSDRDQFFFVFTLTLGSPKFYKFTSAGVQVYSKALPSDWISAFAQGAIELDGSIYYMVKGLSSGSNPTTVYRYNLNTNTQLGNLTVAAGVGPFLGCDDGFVSDDGYLVFAKQDNIDPFSARLYKYNKTTGATVLTLVPDKIDFGNHFCYIDSTRVLFWGYNSDISINSPAFMEYLSLISGTSLQVSPPIPVSLSSNNNPIQGNPNGISNSCPLFVLRQALAVETSKRSGLYKLIRGNTADKYYDSFDPLVLVTLPIRDPFADTFLVGDE